MFVKLLAGSHMCSALVVASWVAQLSVATEESLLSTTDELICLERAVPWDVLLDKTKAPCPTTSVGFDVSE